MQVMHTQTSVNGFKLQKYKVNLGTMTVTLQTVSGFPAFDYIRKGIKYYPGAHS